MTTYSSSVKPDHWANLLWTLSAPHIVRDCGLPLLPVERQVALRDFFDSGETRARLAPALDQFLAEHVARRLGIYFEHLWAFAFSHHPHYRLLSRNLPLRQEGRTLGELDFLVQYLPEDCTEHWEVAVKFYLQVDARHWVGPGLRDRLDTKLARMRDHQLPVARTDLARTTLARQSLQVSRQWAVIPGRLFRPIVAPPPLPAEINPALCDFWWATPGDFSAHFHDGDWHWGQLAKQAWLDNHHYRMESRMRAGQIATAFHTDQPRRPWCVAAQNEGREVSRGFIVPADWHQRALSVLSPQEPDRG